VAASSPMGTMWRSPSAGRRGALAVLLDVLIARPVLLPAAEALLGKLGWWPTSNPSAEDTGARTKRPPRRAHLHLPHRPSHASR